MDLISYALSKKPNWDNIKNRPFGETVIDTDITGTERIIEVNSNIKEYQISPLPLQIGQKWDMYYIQGSVKEVLYSSNLEVTSQNGNLYLGDIELKSNVFCITKDKMLINTSFLYMLNVTSIKVVCVEGVKTETSLEKIDKKFLYNDWNELDNRPFYDDSWVLDTSNSLDWFEYSSEYGLKLISSNPDDFIDYNNNIILYDYLDISGKEPYIIENDTYTTFNTANDSSIKTLAVIVYQDNSTVLLELGDGSSPHMTTLSAGIWVNISPGDSSTHANVSLYTGIKQLDSKFIPYSAKHMIINVTGNADRTLSADKTFEEILKAYNSGALIYVRFYDLIVPMFQYIEEEDMFLFLISSMSGNITIVIGILNEEQVFEEEYPFVCDLGSMNQDLFLRGDGSWGKLPLSFNDAGELEVTLNGVTKTFVPKE